MHVLDRQHGWCREAAECGARILAIEERNARAASRRRTRRRRSASAPTSTWCARPDACCSPRRSRTTPVSRRGRHGWGVLGERLIEETVAGRRFSSLMHATLGLARPLVAIGAPVGAYYPEVARRLGAQLSIPEHAAVCNAVGAVAGVVSQTVEILVNQPTFKVFRVHDPAGSQDYPDPEPALEHAQRVSRAARARRGAPRRRGRSARRHQRERKARAGRSRRRITWPRRWRVRPRPAVRSPATRRRARYRIKACRRIA